RHCETQCTEARDFLDRSRGRTTTEPSDFVAERIWTTPAAQNYFMAPGQRLSPECERHSAGADRAKFHTSLLSFENSIRTKPARPARPARASGSAIRDGKEGSATFTRARLCEGRG